MKLHEYNFRDIYQHIVEIHGEKIVEILEGMNLRIDGLCGGFFYGYIDHEQGLTFEVLALEMKDHSIRIAPANMTYKIRCHPLMELDVSVVKDINWDVFKEKVQMIHENYSSNKEYEELRAFLDIDSSRHSEYPDDVVVYFLEEGKDPEACWVRLEGFKDRALIGKLVTKPLQNFGMKIGDTVYFQTMNMEDGSISCVSVIQKDFS